MNSKQIVLQLSAEIRDVFLALKMRKETIEKKYSRFSSRNGTTQARQIMDLSERARERRLASLVRAGDDQDSFLFAKIEIVANNSGLFANQFAGQRQIEALAVANFLARV